MRLVRVDPKHVGLCEVITFEKQRFAGVRSERIRDAIREIEARGV